MKTTSWDKSLNLDTGRFFEQWHNDVADPESQSPLRAELFSADQMEQHGRALARMHRLGPLSKSTLLLERLDDNQQILLQCRTLLSETVKAKSRIAPAGEWLLDNFYLIDEQIRTARKHLPKGFSRELPRLAEGPSADLPRVYDLALEVISHGDGRIDIETLCRFIAAYQTLNPLNLGELWATPIMLRLALIENLRRVAARITASREHINKAQDWANSMIEIAERDPKSLILIIADMARSKPPMVSSFVAELTRRLQGHGPALALPLTWIEQRLAESSLTIEQMVLIETQQQAADQVSISNSIGSLRVLGATDWRQFVEAMSVVEKTLQQDPVGVYDKMDFATRDSYRRVIDYLAKHSDASEAEIANAAIQLAHAQAANNESNQTHTVHVGYYLIDKGLPELEQVTKVRLPITARLRRWAGCFPLTLHVGSIVLLTLLFSTILVDQVQSSGVRGWPLWVIALLALIATSQLASALINWLALMMIKPRLLPRMNYQDGLPIHARTMVVIPTLLTSFDHIEELLEALEVRFLGNRDVHLHFALLTDFADAPNEVMPGDAELLAQARIGIERLNEKYPLNDEFDGDTRYEPENNRFFLFHRPRLWNPVDQVWMGYERKRGKLADLNAFLRANPQEDHAARSKFSLIVGNTSKLDELKYIITLDTDTQLPRDTAREFVGTMEHPLNRPRYNTAKQCVTGGYGILQPRLAASMAGANRSVYAQLFGNEPGIDPYTRSVSDIYQDLFQEGSFIGKGIYNIDAFEHTLKDRLPQNRILSHDLLEGCYARSGLISDVHLLEEHPTHYIADVSRRSRWIRGDWQIASWILPRVPGAAGKRLPNPLSALSRWKIMDNLVRSLSPIALLMLLLLGWWIAGQIWFWTLAVVSVILIPSLLFAVVDTFRKPEEVVFQEHFMAVVKSAARNLAQAGFRLACLPHEAMYSMAAILCSMGRVLFTRRLLLEWNVYNYADRVSNLGQTARAMWSNYAVSIVAAAGLAVLNPFGLTAAAPVLALWIAAPYLAWRISQPKVAKSVDLPSKDLVFLRKIARKTWAFFDRFVTAEDNWLPPDNMQEDPGPIVAHRTSPTNIGLALLSNLTAYDFGYNTTGQMLRRTANTFETMARMERHFGHFYNWYDTRNLYPLPPRYISTVDSGNLVGHLLTLRAGFVTLPEHPVIGTQVFDGFMDTLLILSDNAPLAHQPLIAQLIMQTKAACNAKPNTLKSILHFLKPIVVGSATLSEQFDALLDTEAGFWAQAFTQQAQAVHEELLFLAPWLDLPDAPAKLAHLDDFELVPSLEQLARYDDVLLAHTALTLSSARHLSIAQETHFTHEEHEWLNEKSALFSLAHERAIERMSQIQQLIVQCTDFSTIDYEFLYDPNRHLLAIGYNVDDFRRDTSFYDLLASEARLCNFIAIAQDQLPQESWFALGRLRTTTGGEPILVSWSGSMFEYLMPMLVMPSYENTLLDQTCRAAVARQIAYGKQRGLPWGISESGYNTVDAALNYQYHAFGVPGLGLKRGLSEDTVIAPYASVMALMVAPEEACDNLRRLAANGLEGRYGFYEAMDYTPARLSRGQTSALVCSFMVHHQGMSLLALAYLLLNRPMQARFESDPALQATLLLLQERIPKRAVIHNHSTDDHEGGAFFDSNEASVHTAIGAETAVPDVQLLSNGRYQVMLTNAGGGYSRWREFAVTRWREDTTCDNWGSFIYLRDLDSGDFWSAAHQPTLKRADTYAAMFSEGRAEYRRRDTDIESYSEVVVSPEDDIELRRVRITNRSGRRRVIEVTSYAEVVLATQASDATQAAFGKLFVQTEILPNQRALLCTKRPRSTEEFTPWMFHLLSVQGGEVTNVSYETDRLKFIGRGRTLVAPKALVETNDLSGSQGSVLDPVVAIRCCITLEAEQWITLNFVSGAAASREASMILIEKYQDFHFADRALDLASTHSGVTLRQINATESDALLYRRLARSVIYSHSALRADAGIIMQNRRGQSGLWGYAISGDLPIVLLKIANSEHIELARQLIQCHIYWRLKGLAVDLVIWNEDHAGYRQRLQDQIIGLIATGTEANTIDRPGGIFVRSAEQISHEDRVLLQSVARVIVADGRGTLLEQLNRRPLVEKRIARLKPTRRYRSETLQQLPPIPTLRLGNPIGGFSADGREYIITTHPSQVTPLPWVNVLANPNFGTVITESGLAYTWSENAHEYRLTPWSDDAVGATGGEAIYLRDDESGHFWSPSPLPCRSKAPYTTRHGFGYSVFEHLEDGISSELWVYVDLVDSVKYSVLKVRNQSGRSRRLSATGYVEWVLGDLRSKTAMHVVTEIDPTSGALFAHNAYSTEFSSRVAFFDVDDISRTLSGDRTEFLGRNGSLSNPDAMTRAQLSGRLGAAFDPCGAIQVPFELGHGQSRELIFRLGSGHDLAQTRALAQRLRTTGSARAALQKVQHYWQQTLDAVQVETPDESINMLANGWLMYQTLACRIWARSGYYQSGGAYGFRDQLQDTMALVHTRPELIREHIVRSAQRQYPAGDVQHWWHPPVGRGVRTRCSDDYLWLPLAACRYVQTTGDLSILDERLHFLDGRELNPEEESYYDLPGHSAEIATLYQHCQRAIRHGLRYGEHGIPLMGSGDWNDGMNLVGIHGKGESVWLGFFLYDVLIKFADLAGIYNDREFVEFCEKEAFQLRRNLEQHAWDGAWYKRAWFDDGAALGTATNSECMIDSISQSWSVLSGAGSEEHSQKAMEALDKHLVKREHGLIQLLEPPFDKSPMNPGYIKGYVPGVRENGGQYTHAAVWAIMAFAALGDSKRAWELLTLINPLNHTNTAEALSIYKAEPYVVAADVYGVAPHIGRGGWSWYTGSAGLFYRLIVESLLGITRVGNQLHFNPCIPEDWSSYTINYRFGETVYRIAITQQHGKPELKLDGTLLSKDYLDLINDGQTHQVELTGYFQKTTQ